MAGWSALLVVALLNGTLRQLVTQPLLGEQAARRLATLLLLVVLTSWAWWLHHRWPIRGPGAAWAIGGVWVALTLGFEVGFGRLVEGLSWSAVFADYDLTAGRIWVLVPLWMLVLPSVVRLLQVETRYPVGRR
ncbi:hypothetical protein [Pseudonocardia lacus]|uniref:hypothetical protein n=1 Tax=Pseudonocardia lacus TaxID=2835865 RepID=UPI001BDD5D07|nr:hypothetical protein [Pseudonocardia lacus]